MIIVGKTSSAVVLLKSQKIHPSKVKSGCLSFPVIKLFLTLHELFWYIVGIEREF